MASLGFLNPLTSTAATAFGAAGAVETISGPKSEFFTNILASAYMGFGSSALLLTIVPAVVLGMSGRDLLSKERSGLSKAFAGVAAASAAVAAVASLNPIAGDSLAPLFTCYAATAVAGATSLLSHLTRNTSLSVGIEVKKNPPPAAPSAPKA